MKAAGMHFDGRNVLAIALVGSLLGFGKSNAQSSGGQTAAAFLKVGMGARSAGLGGAYIAICNDASAIYWNAAGLAGREQSEALFAHHAWLQDVSMQYAALSTPIGERVGIGGGFTYVSYGNIEGFDANDRPTGTLPAVYDYAASVGVGYSATDNFRVGGVVKYISQSLGDVRATAFAGDLGAIFTVRKFALAATFSNIGEKLVFIAEGDELPAAARIGVAYTPPDGPILTTIDIEIPKEGEPVAHYGLEYNFDQKYYLRGGYAFFPTQGERDFGVGLAAGAGLRLKNYLIDYSFSPEQHLNGEAIHRFSLGLKFGG